MGRACFAQEPGQLRIVDAEDGQGGGVHLLLFYRAAPVTFCVYVSERCAGSPRYVVWASIGSGAPSERPEEATLLPN